MATSVIKPVHAGIDLSFTIPVSGWSSTAPYTYTWTDSRVTSGCRVEAGFFSGATDTSVAYLEYEKVTGGVQFTSPVLPTVAIPVIVHIISAQAGNTTSITGDMVQTSVISGAANVDEALNKINSIIKTVDYTATWQKLAAGSNLDLTGTNFSYTAYPAGYTPIGVIQASSGNANVIVNYFSAVGTGSNVALRLRNMGTSEAQSSTNATAHLRIAFIRTDFAV